MTRIVEQSLTQTRRAPLAGIGRQQPGPILAAALSPVHLRLLPSMSRRNSEYCA